MCKLAFKCFFFQNVLKKVNWKLTLWLTQLMAWLTGLSDMVNIQSRNRKR